jgi:hypothetical protein
MGSRGGEKDVERRYSKIVTLKLITCAYLVNLGRTPVNQEYRQEYRQWRGIVYLFRPNGAIDRNYIPKGTSADLDERWAADVTQTKMDSMRTTISAHLV